MVKHIVIIILILVASLCGKSIKQNHSAHYNITDIRTAAFLQYLSESDTNQLPYFEKKIIEELKNLEWQNTVFEEYAYDSICHLLLSPIEIIGFPGIKMSGFEILIDSNGSLSHNAKYSVSDNMVNKYWSYYRPSGIKSLHLWERAECKLVKIPDIGEYIGSKGFIEIGIMLSESNNSKRKALRSLRDLFHGLYSKVIQYRNKLSNEFFFEDFSQLSKRDWLKIVRATQFYCEIRLFYFNSNESEEDFRRYY